MAHSKILNLNYKVIEWENKKPTCILFEDNVMYNKRELEIVAQMDNESKVEAHKVKKCFDGMLVALNQVL